MELDHLVAGKIRNANLEVSAVLFQWKFPSLRHKARGTDGRRKLKCQLDVMKRRQFLNDLHAASAGDIASGDLHDAAPTNGWRVKQMEDVALLRRLEG